MLADINAQKDKIADMLRNADEFLEISHNSKTFIPNFVNIAFACELYLKTILEYYTGDFPPIHDLEYLYKTALEYIDENAFLLLLANEISNSLSFDFPQDNIDNARTSLQSMLEKDKHLFIEWRYIFEGKVPKPYIGDLTLKYFAYALRKYVSSMVINECNE